MTPDEMLEEAEFLMGQGREDDAMFLMDQYEQALLDIARTRELPRAPRAAVEFADPAAVAAEREAGIQQAARERVEEFGATLPAGTSVEAARREQADILRAEAERERARVVMPGREQPVSLSEKGLFRGTRIQDYPSLLLEPVEGTGVLRPDILEAREEAAAVPMQDVPKVLRDTLIYPVVQARRYRDPETGALTVPTGAQEAREAFTLQTERSEAGMRAERDALRAQQAELDRRLAEEPETVSWYERYVGTPGQLMSEIFTDPVEGTGVVETPLSGTLRSTLSWISALAAEGYFRMLGYEVDSNGLPVNPDDWGYGLAEFRRQAGKTGADLLRDMGAENLAQEMERASETGVAYPTQYLNLMAQAAEDAGVPKEYTDTAENLLLSIAPIAVPLPGVATESQTRKATTFDPEGRRRVINIEVPDIMEDPKGFFEAEFRRISSNVAKGRTFGDEYLDSPAVRDYYARVTGDPDDAYIAGMLPEILIPAGPELLGGPIGYAAGAAADFARVSKGVTRAKALAKAQAALDDAQEAMKAARRAGDRAAMQAAQSRIGAASDRIQSLERAAGEYDAGVINRLARQAVRRVTGDEELIRRADAALGGEGSLLGRLIREEGTGRSARPPAPKAITVGDVANALKPVLGEKDALRVSRLVGKNIPGDYVMLTDVIAVPRADLPRAKEMLAFHRSQAFRRTGRELYLRLYDEAVKLPDGPLRQQALRTAYDTKAAYEAAPVTGKFGYQDLPKSVRSRFKQVVRAVGRETDPGNADFVKMFDQRKPSEMFMALDTPMAKELAKYASWDDVPAALRRQAIDAYDFQYPSAYAAGARRAGDLTRAQMWFQTQEQIMGLPQRLWSSRLLSGKTGRRLRRRFGRLEEETFAAARAAQELKAAGSTALRTLEERFLKMVRDPRTTSVDDALDKLLEDELLTSDVAASEAWDKVFGHLYGDTLKDKVMAAAMRDGMIPALDVNGVEVITEYPTIKSVRAIDSRFASEAGRDILPGLSILPPDIHAAFLKTVLEDGIRKEILASRKLIHEAGTAPRSVIFGTDEGGTISLRTVMEHMDESLEDFGRRAKELMPFPERGIATEIPDYLDTTFGKRMAVYDTAASFAEAQLAKGGEALFSVLDQVPVRQRANVAKMASEWGMDKLARLRRDVIHRLQYGYIVPNIMGQGAELLRQAITPLVTIGIRDTINATDHMLRQVYRRRMGGGGITTPDGTYLSPRVIEALAESYGIGRTGLEQARTGRLANDLMRTARNLAAREGKIGDPQGLKEVVVARAKQGYRLADSGVGEVLDPRQRGYFLRLAEALELNFRRSVFEMALARGDAPTQAADLARRSQLDFTQVPGFVQEYAAPLFAEAGALYQLGAETLYRIIENPQAATAALKTMRAKAEAQDPYNVYGDKALKSLGLIGVTDKDWGKGKLTFFPPQGEVYYLPELPIFAAPEAMLFAARNADLLIDDIRFAYSKRGAGAAAGEALLSAGEGIAGGVDILAATDILLPAVLEAYEQFGVGDAYVSQGVPDAQPMSDEKVFWSLALLAQANDPDHLPGGEWEQFLTRYQPEHVKPPSGMGSPDDPFLWTQQPPEGIPHVLYDITPEGRNLYYAFKPSETGVRRIAIQRALTPDQIEQVLPFYATLNEQQARTTPPRQLFTEPALPSTPEQVVMETMLPRVEMPVQEARRQQAEAVRGIRQGAVE